MSIHDICKMIDIGNYDRALIAIEMSEENELDLMIFKSIIYRLMELFTPALEEAENALKVAKETESTIHELAAITQIIYLKVLHY